MTRPVPTTWRPLLGVLALVLVVVGCSGDDGAGTRDAGGTVEVIGPQPEGDGGSVSAVGGGCTTRGATTKLSTQTVEVDLDEWSVVAPASAPAGVTRLLVKNFGSSAHGVVLTRAASVASLPRKGTAIDVDALPAGATYRIETFAGRTICEGTFDLPAGTYVIFCPDAGAEGSASHADQGMITTMVLT